MTWGGALEWRLLIGRPWLRWPPMSTPTVAIQDADPGSVLNAYAA